MNLFLPFSRTPPYTGLIRVYGALATLFGLGFCWLAFTVNLGAHGIADWRILLVPGTFIVLIGTGTIFLLRVFSIILSIACTAIGLWLIIGSMLHVLFPWLILNILFGFVALIPLYSLIRIWEITKKTNTDLTRRCS